MRGFPHRSSHHHGSHFAFELRQSHTAPLQCRQYRRWLLHRVLVDRAFSESREGQQALPLVAFGCRATELAAWVERTQRALRERLSFPIPIFISKLGKTKEGRGSQRWRNPMGAASGKTPKWEFPLFSLPNHSKIKPKSGISHSETG